MHRVISGTCSLVIANRFRVGLGAANADYAMKIEIWVE
jgi:hypothetical protein